MYCRFAVVGEREYVCCIWGALIGAGASLLGSAISADSKSEQQEDSFEEAQRNRDFQERMSNSAHQREVADLRAAGLNPILSSGGGGASSPTGSMGTAVDIIGDAAQNGINGAMAAIRLEQDLENMKQNEETSKAQEYNTYVDAQLKAMQENATYEAARKAEAERHESEARTKILNEDLATAKAAATQAEIADKFFSDPDNEWLRKLKIIMSELMPSFSVGNSARSFLRR